MKRQYLALLVIFIVLIALSLWMATQTALPDIETRIFGGNHSHQDSEGIIEAEGLFPYLVVTGLLLAVGVVVYWLLGQRKTH